MEDHPFFIFQQRRDEKDTAGGSLRRSSYSAAKQKQCSFFHLSKARLLRSLDEWGSLGQIDVNYATCSLIISVGTRLFQEESRISQSFPKLFCSYAYQDVFFVDVFWSTIWSALSIYLLSGCKVLAGFSSSDSLRFFGILPRITIVCRSHAFQFSCSFSLSLILFLSVQFSDPGVQVHQLQDFFVEERCEQADEHFHLLFSWG